MTEFFEAFNPSARHLREQRDLEKVLVVQAKQGGTGPRPLDLDSGRITLVRPGEQSPGTGVVVRPARPSEYERIGRLCVRSYLDGGEMSHADPYLATLRDAASRAEAAELWVASEGDELLGTVTWCPAGSTFQDVARENEGEFRVLAVDPRAQGRGAGRLLVDAVVERARADGLSAVVLSTSDWMTAAHRIYRRAGFQRTPERDWSPRPGVSLQTFRLEL